MKTIYILCEGQTEESFVNKVLHAYFAEKNIRVIPIVCVTKRTASKVFKGGVSDYNKIKYDLLKLCQKNRNCIITTLFDYYALPHNTPGLDNNGCQLGRNQGTDIYERVCEIEQAVWQDLGAPQNLKFNLILHEFEGLLFSDYTGFRPIASEKQLAAIKNIRKGFETPEHINNSVLTAPSKRLKKILPGYAKVSSGTIVSAKIGIRKIMEECPHFREWVEFLIQNS